MNNLEHHFFTATVYQWKWALGSKKIASSSVSEFENLHPEIWH